MLLANKLGALGVLLSDALDAALGEISPSAAALLLTLHDRPGSNLSELAAVAGIAQPTAVRIADGLQKRGLLARRGRSGRSLMLALTAEGREAAATLQSARLAALSRLLDAVPTAERRHFEEGLDALLAGATTSRPFARTVCRLCDHGLCSNGLCPIGNRASAIEQEQATTGDADDPRT